MNDTFPDLSEYIKEGIENKIKELSKQLSGLVKENHLDPMSQVFDGSFEIYAVKIWGKNRKLNARFKLTNLRNLSSAGLAQPHVDVEEMAHQTYSADARTQFQASHLSMDVSCSVEIVSEENPSVEVITGKITIPFLFIDVHFFSTIQRAVFGNTCFLNPIVRMKVNTMDPKIHLDVPDLMKDYADNFAKNILKSFKDDIIHQINDQILKDLGGTMSKKLEGCF